MLSQHQINKQLKYEQFKAEIALESLIPCDFKVGDFVTLTNIYNVFIRKPKQVIGFDNDSDLPERFIYTDGIDDAYWFASAPSQLHKVETTSTGCILVRELTPQTLYQFEITLIEEDQDWTRLAFENELHCVWRNDSTLELVTYCEGDIIWTTALNKEMYRAEIFITVSFFNEL
ncbi:MULTISPECIES: hypothetical protein [unclassified Shewanella]|uniref:hypothetical protein n=1 Tax=Shewanella TaxID=22 RepID=UPI0021DB0305|nr:MULTISPECIES: hypothetical protein [unclassified Shewanella]MCU7962131.1 hypothetical protein [Shewanella sp. SW32]MCU7970063.1 hypothetical protein [Shewanella sp. SW29]MCU8014956.1 hypothetical protein [Shewanella sp. SM74]MCU8056145.1 hypothetical protein [Shewanella sp. SM35]MCU8065079.1 hypothetical protein [Shewanella sp. SM34]